MIITSSRKSCNCDRIIVVYQDQQQLSYAWTDINDGLPLVHWQFIETKINLSLYFYNLFRMSLYAYLLYSLHTHLIVYDFVQLSVLSRTNKILLTYYSL